MVGVQGKGQLEDPQRRPEGMGGTVGRGPGQLEKERGGCGQGCLGRQKSGAAQV